MDSFEETVIKLKDSHPQASSITKCVTYQLYSTPTTTPCISAKTDNNFAQFFGFKSISNHCFVEFKDFFHCVSLASQILRKKYKHSTFTYSSNTVSTLLKTEISSLTEPKLLHAFATGLCNCGIYLCHCDSEYKTVLKISLPENMQTFVVLSDSTNILQSFFHPYIATLCSSQPYNCIYSVHSGITINNTLYTTSKKMLIDLSKIVHKISTMSKSFDTFVNTLEKILILAHRSRHYSLSNANQYNLLKFLSYYGSNLEAQQLVELISLSDSVMICEEKFHKFSNELKKAKENLNLLIDLQ